MSFDKIAMLVMKAIEYSGPVLEVISLFTKAKDPSVTPEQLREDLAKIEENQKKRRDAIDAVFEGE